MHSSSWCLVGPLCYLFIFPQNSQYLGHLLSLMTPKFECIYNGSPEDQQPFVFSSASSFSPSFSASSSLLLRPFPHFFSSFISFPIFLMKREKCETRIVSSLPIFPLYFCASFPFSLSLFSSSPSSLFLSFYIFFFFFFLFDPYSVYLFFQ